MPRRPASAPSTIHQGKELSYTNLLDLDAAARIVLEFDEPAAVVIKHTNPCGVATGATSPTRTCARARPMRSRRSAASSASTARSMSRPREAIVSTFIEAVIAPAVDEAARPILATKANLRVVTADFAALPRAGGARAASRFSAPCWCRSAIA